MMNNILSALKYYFSKEGMLDRMKIDNPGMLDRQKIDNWRTKVSEEQPSNDLLNKSDMSIPNSNAKTAEEILSKEHLVSSGDTLSAIAKKYNTNIDALLKSNSSITDPDKIYVGQKITIPGDTKTSSSDVDLNIISDTKKDETPKTDTSKSSTTYGINNKDVAERIINKTIPYVYNDRIQLTPAQEIKFQEWWKPTASANALNVDADSKDQDYDYRKLWAVETTKDPTVDPITKISSEYLARRIDTDKLKNELADDKTSLYNYSDDALKTIAKNLYNTQQEEAVRVEAERQKSISDVVNALIKRGVYPETFTPKTAEVYEAIRNTNETSGLMATYNSLLQKEQRGDILSETDKAIYDAIKFKLNL